MRSSSYYICTMFKLVILHPPFYLFTYLNRNT